MKSDWVKPSNTFSRGIHTFLLILITLAFATCSKGRQSSKEWGAGMDLHGLTEFITKLTPEDWDLYDKVGFFTAANLYERIDGRAELYLSYDVVSLTTATFERKDNIDDFIEVSVYDLGDPTNAFGIFSVERSSGEAPLDLGRISYSTDANHYIWKGRYYITVIATGTTEEFERLSLELAHKITTHLRDSGEPVWGLTAFPSDDLIPDSIRYFKVDAVGLDFMRDTYTAKYQSGDTEVTVFVSQKSSTEAAGRTVDQYLKYCENYGQGNNHITQNGLDLSVCDIGGAFDVILLKDRYVCGVISAREKDEAIAGAVKIFEKF